MSQSRRLAGAVAGAVLVSPMLATVPAVAAPKIPAPDHTKRPYIVQLADAPIASYQGNVPGFAVTKPGKGKKLQAQSPAALKWKNRLVAKHDASLKAIGADPSRKIRDYSIAFNGYAAQLTDAEVAKLRHTPGVMNIWKDEIRYAETTTTRDFLGMSGGRGVWAKQFGTTANAGKGVVVGVIDSGIDSHNPSFDPMPGRSVPSTFTGVCDKGADPAFRCSNKIIGARYYAGGNTGNEPGSWETLSPSDRNGHGSHTASTAAGNFGVPIKIQGYDLGQISGMAPAAQISVYKALWLTEDGRGSGATNGLVQAIEDATADGVDVINYSVSGSREYVITPDELAFMGAADAGVFISASAGNSGEDGPSMVAHNGPWTMTVAASTHDRPGQVRDLVLGDGTTIEGFGMGPGVGPDPLVYAGDIPAAGVTAEQAKLCLADADQDPANGTQPTLDPAKAKGAIVICIRGVNARVEKSQVVKDAGGVGMVQINANDAQTLNADFHAVPSIHISATAGAPVLAYAKTTNPTATLSDARPGEKPVAPQMAEFSSYGPALAGKGDLLKPDITAPGVDILAAIQAGENGEPQWDSMQGTSMSAPHIAGLAALMVQKYPTWSPMMIKSALMTTATPLASDGKQITRAGETATPLNFGAGHVRPALAYNPGLVYNNGYADWVAYACSIKQMQMVDDAVCASVPQIDPSDLNYPTMAIGDLVGRQTIKRTVTNVESKATQYRAEVKAPAGTKVTVSPSKMTLAPGRSATFTVTIERTTAPLNAYTFGTLTWRGNRGQAVQSPIAVRPVAVSAPESISATGVSGTATYAVKTGFTGPTTVDVNGLAAAQVQDVEVVRDPSSPVDGFAEITVEPGTKYLKLATYGDEVKAADIDIQLVNSEFKPVMVAATEGSSEWILIEAPAAGTYYLVIDLYSEEPSVTVPLNVWQVGEAPVGNMTATINPTNATMAGTSTVTVSYQGLEAGKHYLGAVNVTGGGDTGTTLVEVDA